MMVVSHAAPHGPEDSARSTPSTSRTLPSTSRPPTTTPPTLDKHWIMQYTGPMRPITWSSPTSCTERGCRRSCRWTTPCRRCLTCWRKPESWTTRTSSTRRTTDITSGSLGWVKGKSMPYDFDIRVPFFLRGPNIEQGAVNPHMVLNIDLAPTILHIAGLDPPADMDGKSILKLLEQDRTGNRSAFTLDDSSPGCRSAADDSKPTRKPKVLRDTFLVERGKILRKKEDSATPQNTNSLPKYKKVMETCQQAEFQTPCQQPGQPEPDLILKVLNSTACFCFCLGDRPAVCCGSEDVLPRDVSASSWSRVSIVVSEAAAADEGLAQRKPEPPHSLVFRSSVPTLIL
ncbi:hypothetical protein KUCAC02_036540 [Chaenocephalus aceratus]|nr:hypothetical protein KUCAC02_036540 [Chaenocephalus aceratus]